MGVGVGVGGGGGGGEVSRGPHFLLGGGWLFLLMMGGLDEVGFGGRVVGERKVGGLVYIWLGGCDNGLERRILESLGEI